VKAIKASETHSAKHQCSSQLQKISGYTIVSSITSSRTQKQGVRLKLRTPRVARPNLAKLYKNWECP